MKIRALIKYVGRHWRGIGSVGVLLVLMVAGSASQTLPQRSDSMRLDTMVSVGDLGLDLGSDTAAAGDATVWKAPMLPPAEDSLEFEPGIDYNEIARQMGDYAANYLGVRYRFGATGPKAFDCSGFTSHVFKNFGLNLNRTSRAQYRQGDKVDISDVKPGDLLFFSGRRVSKRVGHVGMVVSVDPVTGECEMIHASSSQGIARQKFPDNGYFSRRFIGARRYLGTNGFTEATPKT